MRLLVSEIPSLGGWDALLRLALAGVLGAAVGFERERLDELLDLAAAGIEDLQRFQEEAIAVPRE